MAERRMFAKSIIGSAKFLRMPPSSRLLYYDLGMYADDEGVVEAFTVMRQTNATEDDLRVLVIKGFVRVLNEDLVTVIMDWNENNYIRNDRKRRSIYNNLLLEMTDTCQTVDRHMSDTCQSSGSIGKDRIGKDRLGKSSSSAFVPPTRAEVITYFEEKGFIVDPNYFYDYYDSDNWLKGNPRNNKKEPMKNWKQTAISWNKRQLERNQQQQPPQTERKKSQEEVDREMEIFAKLRREEREAHREQSGHKR